MSEGKTGAEAAAFLPESQSRSVPSCLSHCLHDGSRMAQRDAAGWNPGCGVCAPWGCSAAGAPLRTPPGPTPCPRPRAPRPLPRRPRPLRRPHPPRQPMGWRDGRRARPAPVRAAALYSAAISAAPRRPQRRLPPRLAPRLAPRLLALARRRLPP